MTPLFLLFLPGLALSQQQQPLCLPPRIPRSAQESATNGPLYYNSLPYYTNSLGDATQIDNMCLTSFTLTDCYDLLLVYMSTVYTDGTNKVTPYILASDTPGFFRYASPDLQFNGTVFATDDTSDYVFRTTRSESFAFTITRNYTLYPTQLQYIMKSFGYDNTDYYRLPMRLAPQCVTCVTCSANGLGCTTNNAQTRACTTDNCPTNNCPNNNCPTSSSPSYYYPSNNCPTCNQPSTTCGCQNQALLN